jgi:hypothetical protein
VHARQARDLLMYTREVGWGRWGPDGGSRTRGEVEAWR